MAKTLCDYSTLTVANVPVGPAINTGARNFELRTGLIVMVQTNQFYGLPSEDASAHLQHFLELCNTIIIKDVVLASIRLCLFPFSLVGKVKQWFYKEKEAVSTWDKYSVVFLVKFFPMGKTNALRGKISNFQQTSLESIPEAREGLQDYIQACPHHGMENWLVLHNFYEDLTPISKGHVGAATRGVFLSLTIDGATTLIENDGGQSELGEERKQQKGMHTVKEADMFATKIDLLLSRLNERAHEKEAMEATVQAIDSQMTCEVCGEVGHSRNNGPKTHKDASYISNKF
jgi:hypothetical protein